MSERPIPDSFLQGSAAEHAAPFVRALADTMAPRADTMIGAWRLLGELGRGGMGTVYLAERADQQYDQRVALKVVRGPLTLDDHLIQRFREERQILAALDHPGIARLFDGGVTPEGLPWYAMEHVDGSPIDRHAREAELSIPARLRLFLAACEAVEYAHGQLVVHRDLKPSNLLVTPAGHVKLVDFGIARLLQAGPATVPGTGDSGPLQVTPAYASPEQLRGESIAVSSDVYSLGVILHELLTDVRPASDDALRSAPSQVAKNAVIARRLRGDLDAIVLKALAHEPTDRYASVGALADDVSRHLAGDRVVARGDAPTYRLYSFVRRHRIGVTAAALVTLALVTGLSLALVAARRADRERDAARLAATQAEQVSGFLTRVLYLADPNAALGETVTVAAAIDSAAAWLERDLEASPAAHAELALVLANLYGATGQLARHRLMADSALATQERLWGPDDPRLAPAMGSVAEAMWGTKDLAAHEAMLRRMIALAARDSVMGTFTGVHGRNLLAISLRDQGRLEEAEAVLQEILADRERLDRVYPVGLDHALTGLGHVQLAAGHLEEAAGSYREVLERRRQSWGTNHPEVANALVNLAQALGRNGHLDESRRLYDEGLAMRRATQGDGHAEIGVDMVGLGDIQQLEGDGEAAARTYAEALVRLRETHGAEHPLTVEVAAKIDAAR